MLSLIIIQIDAAGGISAQWAFGILVAIVGYFAIQTLVRINNNQKEMAKDQKIMANVLLQMLTHMSRDDDYFEELAKQLNQN